MATKGKTRGPKETKYVNRSEKKDEKYQTKRKKVEKQVGAAKKG
jgi:hypothetical protein